MEESAADLDEIGNTKSMKGETEVEQHWNTSFFFFALHYYTRW